jgi:hypothetical protein
MGKRSVTVRAYIRDLSRAAWTDGSFQFVFDRGCFHVFDEPGTDTPGKSNVSKRHRRSCFLILARAISSDHPQITYAHEN